MDSNDYCCNRWNSTRDVDEMKWDLIRDGSIQLLPSDIILTRGSSPYAYGIRFFTRSRKEPKSVVNHSTIVEREVLQKDYVIIDISSTVYRHSLYDYDDGKTGVIILRDITLSKKERKKIRNKAREYLGRGYSPLKVAGQMIDGILGKITGKNHTWFTRKLSFDWLIICSYVVAKAYAITGRLFGVEAGVADPDDILDFAVRHLGKTHSYIFYTDNMIKHLKV